MELAMERRTTHGGGRTLASVRISTAVLETVDFEAARLGRSRSGILREIIAHWATTHGAQPELAFD